MYGNESLSPERAQEVDYHALACAPSGLANMLNNKFTGRCPLLRLLPLQGKMQKLSKNQIKLIRLIRRNKKCIVCDYVIQDSI